ncbi:DUF5710 domain-containing protein [Pseudonocardia sp. McavD-2-B]|uniref:DUF5710 domain-containing protein n=1 Tax=Pseudonocardia sp. McavD-2-B TaxID=2954499 RepID=UPI0035AC254F
MTTNVTTSRPRSQAWLDVPFSEKDQAKAHGARWNLAAKRWYDPRPRAAALQRWAALPDVPDLLTGEDRSFGSGLFVDMIPRTCWFTNVRTCVSPRDWERLRRMILGRAGHRCEACGATADRDAQRWLEAHERWSYDDRTRTQTLRRLICLCSPCHSSTHIGYANVTGRADEALAHLRHVTGMTDQQTARHVDMRPAGCGPNALRAPGAWTCGCSPTPVSLRAAPRRRCSGPAPRTKSSTSTVPMTEQDDDHEHLRLPPGGVGRPQHLGS